MWEQLRAGAAGFKLHEDWGTTPAAIDACLTRRRRVRRAGRHPHRHAERGRLRRGDAAPRSPAGRSTRTTPRAPAAATPPTSSRWRRTRNVLPSSTNPTRPHTVNTLDEHLDMLMVCHHLNPAVAGGPGVRREPDPAVDDRRRGHPPRPRRDLDDRLGLAGDGPDRRGRPPHLADRARDEAPPRLARPATAPPTTTAPAATSPSTRSARRSPTASTARSARSRSASWPTSCCGTRRSSACARTSSSRAA